MGGDNYTVVRLVGLHCLIIALWRITYVRWSKYMRMRYSNLCWITWEHVGFFGVYNIGVYCCMYWYVVAVI